MVYLDRASREQTIEDALEQFKSYGWAASVLLAVSKAAGQDCACIPQIASGLGGGLSVGEVCGAVSGGVLVVGLLYGQDGKQVVRSMTHEFVQKFAARSKTLRCKDLLGLDLSTAEGVQAYRAQNFKTKCDEFVGSAVALLFDLSGNVPLE